MTTYLVSIEWDGKKGNGTYYSRLKRFGIHVRGEKDKEPSERRKFESSAKFASRTSWDGTERIVLDKYGAEEAIAGTTVQEGSIFTQSESFARFLAQLAKTYGARQVMVGIIDMSQYQPTKRDLEIFNDIQNKISRRGRVSEDSIMDMVVTCHECCKSSQLYDVTSALVCPRCSATNISARPGKMIKMNVQDSTLLDRWKTTRFVFGQFEVPDIDPSLVAMPILPTDALGKVEKEILTKFIGNQALVDRIDKSGLLDEQKMLLLDALFSAYAYHSADKREESRIDACTVLYKNGIDPSLVPIRVPKGMIDVLDCAAVLGANKAVKFFYGIGLNNHNTVS